MKTYFLFTLMFTLPVLCSAYPITPRPLRKLVVESQHIIRCVVIKVGEIDRKTNEYDSWDRDFARIVVKETWQGALQSDTITVYFASGMACPAPGVFFENEEVLAFLDKRKRAPGYEVHALSYGVKHGLTDAEFLLFKTRVEEMQAFIKEGKQNNVNAITEWLVNCAAEKCTRWDGVYELVPHSDFMSYYDRDQCTRKDVFINPAQTKRLLEVLLRIDTIGYYDLGLADVLAGVDDESLFRFLKKQLAILPKDDCYTAADLINRISQFADDAQLRTMHKELEEALYGYEDKDIKKRDRLLEQCIERIKNSRLKKRLVASGSNNI